MTEPETETRPVSAVEAAVFWTIVVGGLVYAGVGVVYAAGHAIDRAGITGLGAFFAWLSQVLGWPLMLFLR
jgi:hypothetical protein